MPSSFPTFLLFQATSSLDSSARTLKIAKSLTRKRIRRYGGQLSLLPSLPSTLISSTFCKRFSLLLFLLLFFRLAIFSFSLSPDPSPLVLFASSGMIPHSSRTGAVLDKRNVVSSIAYAEISVGQIESSALSPPDKSRDMHMMRLIARVSNFSGNVTDANSAIACRLSENTPRRGREIVYHSRCRTRKQFPEYAGKRCADAIFPISRSFARKNIQCDLNSFFVTLLH